MKRITCLTLLFVMALVTPVFADDVQPVNAQVNAILAANTTPAAKAAALMPLVNTATSIRASQKAEFAKMMPKKDAIELAASTLNKYLPAHNTAVANLNIEIGQQLADAARNQAAQNRHNANPCEYPENNPSVCAWYNNEAQNLNNEANQINALGERLNARSDDLNAEKAKLDEIQKNLSADVLQYTSWQKSYNANVQQNEANIALLVSTLKQVLKSNDDCKKAIAGGTNENMSEICGQLFDGNAIHDGKNPNQGTGTNVFGRGANPTNEQEPHN